LRQSSKDPEREKAVKAAAVGGKVPLTIVRPGAVQAAPGGVKELLFSQGDDPAGDVSLEDLAEVCVRALGAPPGEMGAGGLLEFEVVNGGGGGGTGGGGGKLESDWGGLFGGLSNN
jgi:hypothetical protein